MRATRAAPLGQDGFARSKLGFPFLPPLGSQALGNERPQKGDQPEVRPLGSPRRMCRHAALHARDVFGVLGFIGWVCSINR